MSLAKTYEDTISEFDTGLLLFIPTIYSSIFLAEHQPKSQHIVSVNNRNPIPNADMQNYLEKLKEENQSSIVDK